MNRDEIKLIVEHHFIGFRREPLDFLVIILFMSANSALFLGCQQSSPFQKAGEINVVLFGTEQQRLSGIFKDNKSVRLVSPRAKTAIEEFKSNEETDVVIEANRSDVPPSRLVAAITYDSGRVGSYEAVLQILGQLGDLREKMKADQLAAAGANETWALTTDFVLANGAVASKPNKQVDVANLSAILISYCTALLTSIFGDYFVSAERRRGSFVLILMSPTEKTSFLVANFLVTIAVTMFVLTANYFLMIYMIHGQIFAGTNESVTELLIRSLVGLLLCLPLVTVCASTATLMATYSHPGGKSAPMMLSMQVGLIELLAATVYLPANMTSFPFALLPIGGVCMSIRDALLGNFNPAFMLLAVLSTLTLAVCALWCAITRMQKIRLLEKLVEDSG